MGYGGKTANGLSSLGPKMGGKAHGGGVKIEKNNISQSQDNVLSGKFTSMGSAKIVGKGMMKYLAGEPVGMGKYKSNAQRKAAHASMAEQGAGKYGKHEGAAQAKPDYIDIDGDGNKTESMKQAADGMGKYGKHKGPKKANYDKDMAEERIQIKNDKEKIFQDDKKKRDSEGPAKKSYKQAYKDRDQKTYGKMSEEEYIKEAKRQNASKKAGKGYDAPKKPITKAKVDPKKPESTKTNSKKEKKKLVDKKVEVKGNQEARQDTRKSKRIKKRANRVQKREDIRSGRAKAKADGLKGKAKRDAIKAAKVAAKKKQSKANK